MTIFTSSSSDTECTSTETVWQGAQRTATSTFTQLLSSSSRQKTKTNNSPLLLLSPSLMFYFCDDCVVQEFPSTFSFGTKSNNEAKLKNKKQNWEKSLFSWQSSVNRPLFVPFHFYFYTSDVCILLFLISNVLVRPPSVRKGAVPILGTIVVSL